MKRIGKILATGIACSMANDTIGKEIRKMEDEISSKSYSIALSVVPKEVMDFYLKYPQYTNTCGSVAFRYGTSTDKYATLTDSIPAVNGNRPYIDLHVSDYEWITNKKIEIKELEDKKLKLINQIQSTLLQLSTPKRIKEQFPEAYEYLEEESETCTDIALPIEELQSLLASYK